MFKFLLEMIFHRAPDNLKIHVVNEDGFRPLRILKNKLYNWFVTHHSVCPITSTNHKTKHLQISKLTSEVYQVRNKTNLEFNSFLFSNEFQNQKNSNNLIQDGSENFSSADRKPQSRVNLRGNELSKQQVVSITYEEIGLFPRSFNRVFDRFFKQLFFDVENLVIQEYRFYRYLFLTTVKCLFILIFVPLSVNFIAKNYLVHPITEYYWNANQTEIFLNSYQQKRAYRQLQDFEEKIYFESLILPLSSKSDNAFQKDIPANLATKLPEQLPELLNNTFYSPKQEFQKNTYGPELLPTQFPNRPDGKLEYSSKKINRTNEQNHLEEGTKNQAQMVTENQNSLTQSFNQLIQMRLQEKTIELAIHFNGESIEAITNFFADLISFATLCFLILNLEIQINITKSFLLEVFFGLDDSKKSLLILFLTDLLVGYHSPNIWELFFQSLFDHYGLPESETTIFLLVATLPVLLDVLFKYLIFRHLNRASPATVATYHAMIE